MKILLKALLVLILVSVSAGIGRGEAPADSLVVYSMNGCPPCRVLAPKIQKLKDLGYKVVTRKLSDLGPGDWRPKLFPSIHFFDCKKHLGNLGLNYGSSVQDFRNKLRDDPSE